MARSGPRKVARYGDEFKATAVKLSNLQGVLIQDVAAALAGMERTLDGVETLVHMAINNKLNDKQNGDDKNEG